MYNTADHKLIADFWTKDWQTPFVTKQRNNFYYPGEGYSIQAENRKQVTAMWDLSQISNSGRKYGARAQPRGEKFWEYADLRYERGANDGGFGSNPFAQYASGYDDSTNFGKRSELMLDHVAWYYPKLAAVIAEIVYKMHNIALRTACIDVKEKKLDELTDSALPWNVTITIKHMPNGYEKFETSSGLSSNILHPEYGSDVNEDDNWTSEDQQKFAEDEINKLNWYSRRKIWYDLQPKVDPFSPVKFKVNKKVIRNDLNERKFMFDK